MFFEDSDIEAMRAPIDRGAVGWLRGPVPPEAKGRGRSKKESTKE